MILLPVAAIATPRAVDRPGAASGCPSTSSDYSDLVVPKTSNKVVFSPTKTCGSTTSGTTCSGSAYDFAVNNHTTATQQLLYKGKKFGPAIPPKHYDYFCRNQSQTITVHVQSNSTTTLKAKAVVYQL